MDGTAATIGIFGGLVLIWLVIAAVGIASTVFWIVEIVDVARREFTDPNLKVVWLLIVIFLHLIGAVLYYFIGRPQGRIP